MVGKVIRAQHDDGESPRKNEPGGGNTNANTVYVAPGPEHPALFTTAAVVGRCFWVSGQPPHKLRGGTAGGGGDGDVGSGSRGGGWVRLLAQPRYGATAVPCAVRLLPGGGTELRPSRYCTPPPLRHALQEEEEVDHSDDDEESAAVLEVVFDAPERAVTPGQAMVLYDGRAVQVDPGFARAWFPLVNPK